MKYVISIIIILIFLSLFIEKIEEFIPFDGIIQDIKQRLQKLKEFGNRYSSKEYVINDILKILNCGNKYKFSIVDIEVLSSNSVYTMLYDTKNAFVSHIIFDMSLQKPDKKSSRPYYIVSDISIKDSKTH